MFSCTLQLFVILEIEKGCGWVGGVMQPNNRLLILTKFTSQLRTMKNIHSLDIMGSQIVTAPSTKRYLFYKKSIDKEFPDFYYRFNHKTDRFFKLLVRKF